MVLPCSMSVYADEGSTQRNKKSPCNGLFLFAAGAAILEFGETAESDDGTGNRLFRSVRIATKKETAVGGYCRLVLSGLGMVRGDAPWVKALLVLSKLRAQQNKV
jgi:hypothetical protein